MLRPEGVDQRSCHGGVGSLDDGDVHLPLGEHTGPSLGKLHWSPIVIALA